MRLLVTGGTGFVGGHIAAAATKAGHDVRLLVRRPEQVAITLAPLGAKVDDVVVGDGRPRPGRAHLEHGRAHPARGPQLPHGDVDWSRTAARGGTSSRASRRTRG